MDGGKAAFVREEQRSTAGASARRSVRSGSAGDGGAGALSDEEELRLSRLG